MYGMMNHPLGQVSITTIYQIFWPASPVDQYAHWQTKDVPNQFSDARRSLSLPEENLM
jgi:hypothetical protein